MPIPNMPGFSAEASLHKATRRFQAEAFEQSNALIYPAQGLMPWPVDVVDFGDLDTAQPRTYGTVSGANEDRFHICVMNCRAGGRTRTFADCWRTCCMQISGFQTCVIA
jgi:hypothetical protein